MAQELYPKGSDKCSACKQGINNIYNACVAQNQLEWYYEQTNCSAKRKLMLKAYASNFPQPSAGSSTKKRKPLALLVLKHVVKAETSTDVECVGELMWIGHAIHFYQKPKNGGYDIDEIKTMFRLAAETPGAITDAKGPKKAPLRVWMKTKDTVTYRNSLTKAKQYETTEKTNKKAIQEDIDKALSWIQSGVDKVGGASTGISMQEQAKLMVLSQNDGNEAWSGESINLAGDVRKLLGHDGGGGGEGSRWRDWQQAWRRR